MEERTEKSRYREGPEHAWLWDAEMLSPQRHHRGQNGAGGHSAEPCIEAQK